MKKATVLISMVVLISFGYGRIHAKEYTFQYKLAPGQIWIGTLSSQSESSFMGKKHVNRSKNVIEYKVSTGPKKGWVTVSARIRSKGGAAKGGNQMDLSGMSFKADVHKSGEIRNIQSSGTPMPDLGKSAKQMPKAALEAMKQSFQFMTDAWKNAVFWFPEFPEDPLQPGDEFEMVQKMGAGGSGGGMQMKTVSKQVFTLEEVSDDLAYFSVKERSVTKTSGAMGGKSDTKTASKGEAIFDMRQGMWIELETKSRSKVNMGNMPGTDGSSQDMLQISKVSMERIR
jgi:hypothetical protein